MGAIKPSAEHMERAGRLLVHPMDDLAERVATALADAEARGRKAAFEEAATWHGQRAERAVDHWHLERASGIHLEAVANFRTLAAKES